MERMRLTSTGFLGIGDRQIESAKLYQPDLRNAELVETLSKTQDLSAH